MLNVTKAKSIYRHENDVKKLLVYFSQFKDAKELYTKHCFLSRRKQIEHTMYIAQTITDMQCACFTSSGKNQPTKNIPRSLQKLLILICHDFIED